jgi:hypothetical protein
MTRKRKREAYELEGQELEAYRQGWHDGNEGNYFPGGLDKAAYDWGWKDGKKHGPRKGKPWSLAELMAAKDKRRRK